MSGICGVINSGLENDRLDEVLTEMGRTLLHRGQDGSVQLKDADAGFVEMISNKFNHPVHKKPVANERGNIYVFGDCEIYNFAELREELQHKGHKFHSNTDAEVIVHLYEDHGEKCVDKIRGSFVFAIWDSTKRKLMLYRDRMGSRPLFYTRQGNTFLFASEMKAILSNGNIARELHYQALDNFLTYRLIPEPFTIYKDIFKLQSACYLVYENNKLSVKQYWDYSYQEEKIKSVEEYAEGLLYHLEDAIKIMRIGDLSLGSYLSGGMDSSSVVSLVSNMMDEPLKTFSIAFKEKGFDESYFQRIVADFCHTDHHEFVVEKESVEELLPRIVRFFDQPFGDSSALPSYYLAKQTREHVSAVFTGDGGDELLAGYTTYPGMIQSEKYRKLPGVLSEHAIPQMISLAGRMVPDKYAYHFERLEKVTRDAVLPLEERYKRKISWARKEEKARLYNDHTKTQIEASNISLIEDFFSRTVGKNILSRVNYTDVRFRFVNTVLAKTERTSTANQLMPRSPYLDHKLIEFAMRVPPSLKVKGFKTKYLLHKAMGDKLPKEIHRKQKHGFEPPLAVWFKDELEPYVKKMLLSDDSRVKHYFKEEGLRKTIGIHKEGRKNLSEHLWGLLSFEIWHRNYLG